MNPKLLAEIIRNAELGFDTVMVDPGPPLCRFTFSKPVGYCGSRADEPSEPIRH